MNVTQVGRGRPGASPHRRTSLLAAGGLALVGVGLLTLAVLDGARLELLLASLGFVAGAALVALLTD
jgi:hypothetical protein